MTPIPRDIPLRSFTAKARVAHLSELPAVSGGPALEPSAIRNVVRTLFRVFHALSRAPSDTGGVFHREMHASLRRVRETCRVPLYPQVSSRLALGPVMVVVKIHQRRILSNPDWLFNTNHNTYNTRRCAPFQDQMFLHTPALGVGPSKQILITKSAPG